MTIDYRGGRFGLPSVLLSESFVQRIVQTLPGPVFFPLSKVSVDRPPWWKVMRQQTPGTAGAQQIENGIENFTHIGLSGASACFWGWNQWFDNLPFFIGEIGWIGFSVHKA